MLEAAVDVIEVAISAFEVAADVFEAAVELIVRAGAVGALFLEPICVGSGGEVVAGRAIKL